MQSIVSLSPVDRPIIARAIANRLTLFGGAVVHTEAGPITGRAAQRHRIALLALLASTRRLYRTRDQLVTLLWPDADAERGRKLLSDSIYRINRALGDDAIIGTGEDIRLNRQRVGSDVADFEAAVDAAEWRRAVELYGGPFLDGFFLPGAADFDQWLEIERTQNTRSVARALEALATDACQKGRLAEAVDWWQRLAVLAPDDSRVAMHLMRALEASGNRAGALRHARVHSLFLRETLGVEPDWSVQELADQMAGRREALVAASRVAAIPLAASVPAMGAAPGGAATEVVSTALRVDTRTEHAHPERQPRDEIRYHPPKRRAATDNASTTPGLGSSIAVLPFNNVSDSDTNAYFADGVSEELMYLLTRTPGLRVASRTSSFAYRDLKLDVREVARRLDVDWILEGSVRRSENKLRIVAQLTDARNGYQVWSESFDRTSSDIFEIQGEIAAAIANRLAPCAGGRGGGAPAAFGASDPDTYDIYLQARFQWHRRTEESLGTSVDLFEQVVARDPQYARAWAGLADTYAVLGFYDYLAPRVAFPRADSAARHAILLDSNLAAPYATLAYVDTFYHWNWAAAEQGFRRAIELEPTYSTAHVWYSNLLTACGRFDEAEREMRRAAELDPLSMVAYSAIGWVSIFSDQIDRAIHQLDGALRLDSSFQLALFWMALALELKGQPAKAIPYLQRVLDLSRGCRYQCALSLAALARAHALAGDAEAARAILDDLVDRERGGRYISSYDLAKVYLALGDIPTSLARLERAYADRAHSMALLKVDPQLRRLEGDPLIQRLIERVDQSTGGKAPPG